MVPTASALQARRAPNAPTESAWSRMAGRRAPPSNQNRTERGAPFSVLFKIPALDHGPLSGGLTVFQRLIDCRLTRESAGNNLSNLIAQSLKFRNTDKLNAGIRHLLDAGVSRVRGLHGPESGSGERGGLLIIRIIESRFTGARGYLTPAYVSGYQRDVLFRRGPGSEFLGSFRLFSRLRHPDCPRPEPVRSIWRCFDRRLSVADL